jgi:hypothetical protein
MKRRAFLPLLLVSLLACRSKEPEPPPPAWAALPFSADQLRASHPVGTVLTYRVEQLGGTPTIQRIRVVRADDVYAVLESWTTDEDGKIVAQPISTRKKWAELMDERLFPAAQTVVSQTTCEVPAGTFDCWEYAVTKGDRRQSFYFSKEEPGIPVLSVEEDGGRVKRRVALQSTSRPVQASGNP